MQAVVDSETNHVTVTLSERNLLAMLAQLRDPDRPAPALFRAAGDGQPSLLVQAQTDADHYEDRVPGTMRVSTQKGMRDIEETFTIARVEPEGD